VKILHDPLLNIAVIGCMNMPPPNIAVSFKYLKGDANEVGIHAFASN